MVDQAPCAASPGGEPPSSSAAIAAPGAGMKTAVEIALEKAATPLVVPAEQLPLLPTSAQRAEQESSSAGGTGVGRPRGSRNRRTSELVGFLLSRYTHPLVGLAETYSRPVGVLAAELGCSKLEAFQLQVTAMKELAPYVAQKLPTMIDFKGELGVSGPADESALKDEIARLAREVGVVIDVVPNQGDSK